MNAVTMEHADASARFTVAALERHKREGLELAVKARMIALAVIAVMLPILEPSLEILYYEGMLLAFAAIGLLQRRVGRVGRSRAELALLFCDIFLLTVCLIVPNPLSESDWPTAMEYRGGAFMYFYVFLAAGTLAYSWRTVMAIGVWTSALWSLSVVLVWAISVEDVMLTRAVEAAFGFDPELAAAANPNNLLIDARIQEVVVFLLAAATLAVSVRRYGNLLMGNAALERERANLARYFSPNVVDELSHNDEPLKQIRTQNVAVLFVDIVGFTHYAAERSPEEVIRTLRQFHQRMEVEIFRFDGTLDKYLGDGLMATFGTPFAGDVDALNALRCARAMMARMDAWNAERAAAGASEVRASFGLHYGPAVLGDIGANRLEFAVIGNTVNVASRVEALTRRLSVRMAATVDLLDRARDEAGGADAALEGLVHSEDQAIRGLDAKVGVWTLA